MEYVDEYKKIRRIDKMADKIGILIRNELNLDFNEMFKDAVAQGLEVVHHPVNHTLDAKTVIEAAKGCKYVVAGRENWGKESLDACADTLRFIARFGVGFDTLDLEAAAADGIAISNSPGMNSRSVAEHAVALIFSMLRNITAYDHEMKAGPCKARLSQSVEGTFGLLGFGNIARHVARMLQPFDVKLIAYDLYPNMEAAKELNVEMVSMEEVITRSDLISVHLPLLPDTKEIINKDTIARMKDGVYIVNTARGGLQNEADLYDALKSGKVKAAALDAFVDEPDFCKNPQPLKTLDNCIVTPHAAAVSTQGVRDVMEYCAKVIADFEAGREVRSILNPDYKNNVK